jgi:hypothetical protein
MFHFGALGVPSERPWQDLGKECRRLKERQIEPGNPGTILRDVQTIIEFIGSDGLVTKSRNASFPAARLPELNAKMGSPIQLGLKRALLRDYPNLAGIFILLRVMDLLRMKARRLSVCAAAAEVWRKLNPTGQYFTLSASGGGARKGRCLAASGRPCRLFAG